MVRVLRVCLAFVSVVLVAAATVGCGPQDKQPVPETPTAQPGTPPETPVGEEPRAGEEAGTSVTIDPNDFPIPETPVGSASGRR
ncbi:MAG: hypothetical protein IT364_08220 [Candidatus Hydrogenedentes bacterium]|nr:hypothetical protein [Candidatus Hydrogenedentota bacterium]